MDEIGACVYAKFIKPKRVLFLGISRKSGFKNSSPYERDKEF
jgi:hypothetical protein